MSASKSYGLKHSVARTIEKNWIDLLISEEAANKASHTKPRTARIVEIRIVRRGPVNGGISRSMVHREQIEDLSYQPATNVVCDDDGPLSGQTMFCGVSYTFLRRQDDHPNANNWGDWYDLYPVVLGSGLPMRAMAHFRSADSVRWTSMGSPILKDTTDLRSIFCEFISRLIAGTATYAHWDAFCVAHYRDPILEQVRRDCVRLFMKRDTLSALTPTEVDTFMSLLKRLKEGGE